MVGDSITVGSQDELEDGFAALGLPDVEINAESGRRMLVDGRSTSGLDGVAEVLAECDPPDLWVVALGTNDVANYRGDEYGPAITELLAAIPAGAPLIWVDTYLDSSPDESAAFNDVLRLCSPRGVARRSSIGRRSPPRTACCRRRAPVRLGVQAFSDSVVAAVDAWSA